VSKFWRHTQLCSKCSISSVSSSYFKFIAGEQSLLLVECRFWLAILYLISHVHLALHVVRLLEMYRLITIVRLKNFGENECELWQQTHRQDEFHASVSTFSCMLIHPLIKWMLWTVAGSCNTR
jgi:hypothetical protein